MFSLLKNILMKIQSKVSSNSC